MKAGIMNHTALSFIAAIIVSGFAICFFTNTVIDSYIMSTSWEKNLFEFYEKDKENNKIYIIGDSLAEYGVDPQAIEDLLVSNNRSFKVYNLCHHADTPHIRITELANMAESKPKIVVLCSSIRWFGKDIFFNYPLLEDRSAVVVNKIKLDPYTRSLFNKTELDLIEMDPLHLIVYKRRFIIPSIQLILSEKLRYGDKNSRYVWNKLFKLGLFGTNASFQRVFYFDFKKWTSVINGTPTNESIAAFYKKVPFIEAGDNDEKKAFRYMVRYLREHDINVIIVNMPLNPLYSMHISSERRKNYLDVVTTTGCTYYDLESLCPPNDFKDNMHANYCGRENITKNLAQILLAEARNVSQ